MSHDYKAIQWNPYKVVFDRFLVLGVGLYLGVFVAASIVTAPAGETWSEIQVLMRAFGSAAFGLLTLILLVGPLARLTPRFKPVLYNRRHLGVTMFLLALIHAGLVLLWYHGFSELNVFVSLFASNPRYDALAGFPFESLGFVALVILFLMAATSHDFWNANLGPAVWKGLHMLVYVAFALIVGHVMLGVVQAETNPVYAGVTGLAALLVAGAHLAAGFAGSGAPKGTAPTHEDGWIDVGPVTSLIDGRGVVVAPAGGERIAVFRYDGKISALTNVCRHQGGPLGEGCIKDGLVTCPWHGFQYQPHDGRAPAPFTERIATYRVKVEDGRVYVHQTPLAPGTAVEPARIGIMGDIEGAQS